ncbi:MAG: hypothetical protein U0354_08160 [Candidatus Sericytochromatia bacterium]
MTYKKVNEIYYENIIPNQVICNYNDDWLVTLGNYNKAYIINIQLSNIVFTFNTISKIYKTYDYDYIFFCDEQNYICSLEIKTNNIRKIIKVKTVPKTIYISFDNKYLAFEEESFIKIINIQSNEIFYENNQYDLTIEKLLFTKKNVLFCLSFSKELISFISSFNIQDNIFNSFGLDFMGANDVLLIKDKYLVYCNFPDIIRENFGELVIYDFKNKKDVFVEKVKDGYETLLFNQKYNLLLCTYNNYIDIFDILY